MLDADTKRRIDTARDILVGKVPDPKSQVEQITIALIYKFMDDMDAESEELGGNRKFFAGEFTQYGWPRLVRSGLGGHEVLNLYDEAITRMPENPGIPPLFRDIFKNALLPYRDPETLRAFLKVIDEFEYDHSERLGDAFEYLLSVLGSQGRAGQFRTPRHIIDFIVSIVDPKKGEAVLDPACGTAGFLISSYKHILKSNTDEKGHSTLTPDEKGKLADNFKGYDISPDMVRLSLVNLYLHGFVAPQVHEYDTLTSEDRWNEYADVILANPPFMSPKGGIRPHNRFSVQSKRSEVLFVDYMAEHLTPNGRAGIIVPEGIIFQSQNAYKQLRKMLVEEYLVAVISLPAGVFNPYSGVKTSILILDKGLARRRDSIGFFRVKSDGFNLGAQRRAIDENDLPEIVLAVREYMNMDGQDMQDKDSSESALNQLSEQGSVQIVAKEQIAANGEYNLSGERYRAGQIKSSRYEMIPFENICTLEYGASLPKKNRVDGPYPVMGSNGISGCHNEYLIEGPAIIVGRKGSAGEVTFINSDCFPIDTTYFVKIVDTNRTDILYLYHLLKTLDLPSLRGGAGIPGLNRKDVYEKYKLPLPPLDAQQQIVTEIEGYQKVIDGARAVVENYRQHITIDPDWPMVEIGEYCKVKGGKRLPKGEQLREDPSNHPYIRVSDFRDQTVKLENLKFISEKTHRQIAKYTISSSDVYISIAGTIGIMGTIPENLDGANLTENAAKLSFDTTQFDKKFLSIIGSSDAIQSQIRSLTHAVGVPKLSLERVKSLRFPLPPIKTQQALVAGVEAEQSLVSANQNLVELMEEKIRTAIGRVWNKDKNDQADSSSEVEILSDSVQIPSGLDHIRLLATLGENNRRLSGSKLSDYEHELNVLGISLSILYQAGTCHRKCFGGAHILEAISGRTYNLAYGAYILICRGLYDEALNLIRSMGEISNLFALFLTDRDSQRLWLQSDKRERLNKFSPVKVRKSLEQQESDLMHATQDWYSKFCEDYTHVHPSTRPNVHNEQGNSYIGGVVQKDGLKNSIDELTTVCTYIAMFVSKYAKLDDLFEELSEAIEK